MHRHDDDGESDGGDGDGDGDCDGDDDEAYVRWTMEAMIKRAPSSVSGNVLGA